MNQETRISVRRDVIPVIKEEEEDKDDEGEEDLELVGQA